jgi:1-acyl-sn-glycerol-3-phosphate acyltransferase
MRVRTRGVAEVNVLSLFRLVFIGVHTVLVCPVIVALAVLVDHRAAYRLCRLWARINLFVCGVRVDAHRDPRLDPHRAYVFMSNHKSQFDILALIVALHEFQLRWVAKKELTRVPVFGWALRNAGHIIIDRSRHEQAVASLRAAREQMEGGISVVIFPEGTRARPDDPLLPLKKGGFMLALETGFSIVPIAIRGSERVLPSHSFWIQPGRIEVVVGAPIPVTGRDRDELMEQVRRFMQDPVGEGAPAQVTAAAS